MEPFFTDGPEHCCFWVDKQGHRWWMDWTNVGPIFSRNAFEDGGVPLEDVPEEIRENAEQWALSVLGRHLQLIEREPDYD